MRDTAYNLSPNTEINALIEECHELAAIFGAILRNSQQRSES